MFSATLFILLISLAIATSRILAPNVTVNSPNNNGFKITSSEGRYNLNVYYDDGWRKEEVEEIAPGELQVKGHYELHLANNVKVFVDYEAGRNGYVAKFRTGSKLPLPEIQPQALPIYVLKSNAG